MTEENARRGASNRRKGYAWMQACAAALRGAGWPYAEVVASNGRSDLTGCGDVRPECKSVKGWGDLAAWCAQAAADAARLDLPTSVVWVKRIGKAGPMEGYCVQTAAQYWRDRAEWERLAEVEREYARHRLAMARPGVEA